VTFQLRQHVESLLGTEVVGSQTLTGGDINLAERLSLADGRKVFVKGNPRAPAGMFAAEARGLGWLGAPQVIRIPRTVAFDAHVLILEWVEPGQPAAGFDERLGRELAALHQLSPPSFGLDHDNFIGSLPQTNTTASTWSDFYLGMRLEPQIKRATEAGCLPPRLKRAFARLLPRVGDLVGPPEAPARLHGDLWNGNVLCDAEGRPCLVDPAAYGGHREMDLAMMRLFGGFSSRVFAAYAEAFPLAPGHLDRVPLHQLYPLLVHVNLFGGAYLANLEAALAPLA
jgi:fructosamine-3-kinase